MTTRCVYTVGLLLFLPLLNLNSCDLLPRTPSVPLELAITVQKSQAEAKLTLTVKNKGTQPITLDFNTSQRFDFMAREAGTQHLYWRWSFGQYFLMVLGRETLEPGAVWTFDAAMPYEGLPPTRYDITGILVPKPNSFSSRPVTLDLSDKPLPTEGLEVIMSRILCNFV